MDKKERQKRYYELNKWRWKIYRKNEREFHKEDNRIRARYYNKKLKFIALVKYSSDPPKCACCGETEIDFLTLDHKDNNGSMFKINYNTGRRDKIYQRLKKEGYPKEENLQVLCFNCNCGRQINGGICPHKKSSSLQE